MNIFILLGLVYFRGTKTERVPRYTHQISWEYIQPSSSAEILY